MGQLCATMWSPERMQTSRYLPLALLAAVSVGRAFAFDPVKGPPRTDVIFYEPESYTDIRDSMFSVSTSARDTLLGRLRTYLVRHANRLLTPGQQLKIVVTDLDLAGDFEPWPGVQQGDVRVVRDIYPPDIKLMFQLTDADGHVLKQGERDLTDLNFLLRLAVNLDDPLRFEEDLLGDWLREEFRGLKA